MMTAILLFGGQICGQDDDSLRVDCSAVQQISIIFLSRDHHPCFRVHCVTPIYRLTCRTSVMAFAAKDAAATDKFDLRS